MRLRYCRHCKMTVPMFDDAEYQRLNRVYLQCLKSIKAYRETHNTTLSDTPVDMLYEPFFALYKQLTGIEAGFSADEIMRRHYLSRWKAYSGEG
jgi:hypothetical protein